MKKDIHPSNYREVAFKDMSNEEVFITRSTVNTGQVHAALRQPQEEIRQHGNNAAVSARGWHYTRHSDAPFPSSGGRVACFYSLPNVAVPVRECHYGKNISCIDSVKLTIEFSIP